MRYKLIYGDANHLILQFHDEKFKLSIGTKNRGE